MHDLVDRIYEAAFVPEHWPGVLDTLGNACGAGGGALLVFHSAQAPRFRATERSWEVIDKFCTTEVWKESRIIEHYYSNPFAGFIDGNGYFPEDIQQTESVMRDLRAKGFDDTLGAIVPMPSGDLVGFALHRWMKDGPFEPFGIQMANRFYRHLARSALVAARLGLERATAMVSALDALGVPAAVLSARGRVVASNRLLEEVAEMLKPAAFGGIVIADAAANALFQAALAQADVEVRSIPVAGRDDAAPMVIHVLPIRRSAHDVFSGADLLVAVTRVSPTRLVPAANVLMGLFDLTSAEVKLASALAEGWSLKKAAEDLGIRLSTARSYLEIVFRKTGTHRQAELVALLKSAQPFQS